MLALHVPESAVIFPFQALERNMKRLQWWNKRPADSSPFHWYQEKTRTFSLVSFVVRDTPKLFDGAALLS